MAISSHPDFAGISWPSSDDIHEKKSQGGGHSVAPLIFPQKSAVVSIQRPPVALEADGQHHGEEQGDGPELREDLRQAVPLEQDAADDAQKMGERQHRAEGHQAQIERCREEDEVEQKEVALETFSRLDDATLPAAGHPTRDRPATVRRAVPRAGGGLQYHPTLDF